MQYEVYLKPIGGVHVILAFLKLFMLLKLVRRQLLRVLVLGLLNWSGSRGLFARKLELQGVSR